MDKSIEIKNKWNELITIINNAEISNITSSRSKVLILFSNYIE